MPVACASARICSQTWRSRPVRQSPRRLLWGCRCIGTRLSHFKAGYPCHGCVHIAEAAEALPGSDWPAATQCTGCQPVLKLYSARHYPLHVVHAHPQAEGNDEQNTAAAELSQLRAQTSTAHSLCLVPFQHGHLSPSAHLVSALCIRCVQLLAGLRVQHLPAIPWRPHSLHLLSS